MNVRLPVIELDAGSGYYSDDARSMPPNALVHEFISIYVLTTATAYCTESVSLLTKLQ